MTTHQTGRRVGATAAGCLEPTGDLMPDNPKTEAARRERYAVAIHDAMEPDLSLVDQEPGAQALFARAAEAAMALADTELAAVPVPSTRWEPCSPAWLAAMPEGACSWAPRRAGDGRTVSHYHPAVPVPPTTSTADHPSRRTGLRQQLAAAIWERQNPSRRWADCDYRWKADQEADADAVLAVLLREWPWLRAEAEDAEPTDRAAVLSGRIARLVAEDASALRMDLYDDLAAYARQTGNTGLQHAQIRDHLAEFLFEGLLRRAVAGPAAEAQQQPDTETPYTPPAHYVRDDGVQCCVHAIPVGPDSCRECRDLDQPAVPAKTAASDVLAKAVAALQAKAAELSTEAEEEMRRDLEEQAQVWHEAADMVRRVGRKAAPQ